jgi:hypothetical protein
LLKPIQLPPSTSSVSLFATFVLVQSGARTSLLLRLTATRQSYLEKSFDDARRDWDSGLQVRGQL